MTELNTPTWHIDGFPDYRQDCRLCACNVNLSEGAFCTCNRQYLAKMTAHAENCGGFIHKKEVQ